MTDENDVRGPGTCAWHTPPCRWSETLQRWVPAPARAFPPEGSCMADCTVQSAERPGDNSGVES